MCDGQAYTLATTEPFFLEAPRISHMHLKYPFNLLKVSALQLSVSLHRGGRYVIWQ